MVRETRHLWVGNLPETVREERIREHFKRYGRVQSVKILTSSSVAGSLSSSTAAAATVTPSCVSGVPSASSGKESGSDTNVDEPSASGGSPSCGTATLGGGCGGSCSSNCNTGDSCQTTASGCVASSGGTCGSIPTMQQQQHGGSCQASGSSGKQSVETNSCSSSVGGSKSSSVISGNSVCATVAFMDIKSASKAHTAEHKIDDRILTTEYYEPSSIPSAAVLSSGGSSPLSCSSSSSICGSSVASNCAATGGVAATATSPTAAQQQYSTGSTSVVSRFPSSNSHGGCGGSGVTSSTAPSGGTDEHASTFERTSFYERNTRSTTDPDQYIRRPNNYHSTDVRGRARDRLYRNGPYMIDRSAPVNHHRVPTNTWYDGNSATNVGSTATTSRYTGVSGACASAATTVDATYDLPLGASSALDHRIERRMSETSETSTINKTPSSTVSGMSNSNMKKKKSRSGSESPCGGSLSSRSHSRSPSSCSSTNSSSSNSHGSSSSPHLIGGERTRGQSGGSGIGANPAVHSDDNRPLAICVRNLPARSSDTSLKDGLFHEYKKHGKVTWVKVVGQSTDRYALVCFKKADDVEKALEVSHDKLFFGCKIEVAPYQGYDVDDNEFRPYEAELDEYHPKSTRTLFIGNLEKEITSSDIRKQFENFGEIIEIDVKKQGISSYAFCQYADIVSVVKAMRKMDGEHLGNNRIKLGFGKSMPTNCVWIDGVADTVSESYLTTQFGRFGPVSQVTIDKDRRLALVFFEQIQYAQLAVKEMRGIVLRGRKLQVDFASRECQDAFFDKMDKTMLPERGPPPIFEAQAPAATVPAVAGAPLVAATTTPRFSRYDTAPRSRTSSFTRHGSIPGANSGAASPVAVERSASGGTTPRGAGRPRVMRYNTVDFYDGEYTSDRRSRNYDEYSQGSGASHDGEYEGAGDVFTTYTRPVGTGDSPPVEGGGNGVEAAVPVRRRSEKSPGDIRHLQKERVHLLEQLEECPSSGDEVMSPKKRLRYDSALANDVAHSVVQNNNVVISDSICDASINHSLESSHHHQGAHRKVEVRRLSECSQKMALNRRPSTDGRHHADAMCYTTPHVLCKRRKTTSDTDHHTSRGRGHQLHSHHSHEASGGESADGSRPGTPLCDERPECTTAVPTEPRRIPRERPHEPMMLPLPRFAAQFYLQTRLAAQAAAAAATTTVAQTTTTSSLAHALSSPPPNSILVASSPKVATTHTHHHHHHHHHPPPPVTAVPTSGEQPPASPLRPPSLSSNSSDSEVAPGCSPSLEERIKTLDEMFEKWNGNNATRGHPATTPVPEPKTPAAQPEGSSNSSGSTTSTGTNYRHKFLDLDVNEVQPSDIVRSVLAKKSIFDEDSKRLENIGDKYEPREYLNFARMTSMSPGTPGSAKVPVTQPIFPSPAAVVRLTNSTASPLNSPIGGMSSPYNSPSPSPVTPKPNTPVMAPAKGLQYPFPSHPPAPAVPQSPQTPTTTQQAQPPPDFSKAKTTPITKSISLQEKPQVPNRVLNKSTSLPGSTNAGTTKSFLNKDDQEEPQPQPPPPEKDEKRHNCTQPKEETKRRPDSLDRRKVSVDSAVGEGEHHPSDPIEEDRSESEEKARQERERREREKRREEKERVELEEKERREEEAKRREDERREKEEKDRREREERDRVESERKAELEEIERRDAEERRHQTKDKENRENHEKFSAESTSSYEKYDDGKRRERNNSRSSSPSRSINKRRLSSQENYDLEEIKRLKVNEHRKMSTDRKEITRSDSKTKHHKHRVSTTKNGEDRPAAEERCKKEGERKSKSEKHKSKSNRNRDEHHHHMNNVDHEMSSPSGGFLEQLDMRSSEEEQRKKEQHREKKRDKQRSLSEVSQQEFDFVKHEMRNKEEVKKRTERRGTTEELKSSSASDNGRKGKSRKMNTSDSDDSDEPKKHSIFDIPDEGPTYISMYDKVKARSCKNMQRQEEEKKIKAKFTQLKQSRAKREEKKRSTSWDDDTDSEMDDRRSIKSGHNHKKINSSSEDEMLVNRLPKTEMISDSDGEIRRMQYNRDKINELCDGESSEASAIHPKPRRRITSRKNSRSTRIASDSSEDEALAKIKEEKADLEIKTEMKTELDEKREKIFERSESEDNIGNDLLSSTVIKQEPKDEIDVYKNNLCNISSDEHDMNSTNQKDPFDQLFSPDTRKKHKKKQKRQKSVPPPSTPVDTSEKCMKVLEEVKMEKQVPLDLFDELKKSTVLPEQKKKHSSRKEKKRDRISKEDYENRERFRDERSGKVKKNKKNKGEVYEKGGFIKGEKMEDIFGTISDDDTIQSFPDMVKTEPSLSTSMSSIFEAAPEKKEEIKVDGNNLYKGISGEEFKSASTVLPMQSERERHKDESRKRKEKKRREREKNRAAAVVKEDENSVDLDEAGRALEAQLLKDMDTKVEEIPKAEARSEVIDVFRFTDGDDSIENVMSKDKEKETSEQHRSKEKKKKKKRSKEEKHQRREHHQSKSSVESTKTPNVDKLLDEQKLSKQSPSLPCLLEESPPPPLKNANVNRDARSPMLKAPPTPGKSIVDAKKKPEKFIPGFGGDVDEKIHEYAVKSISTEFTSSVVEKVEPIEEKGELLDPDTSSKGSEGEKADEKTSRVVISQEETEDAVAALLGESFGSSSAPDYADCYETPLNIEESPTSLAQDPVIPEEDAEEMRKAVQSLNADDVEMKPDTPQSEHDLQIDTDTEEPEEEGSALRFDQPPKTPDVDLAALRQEASEKAKVVESPKEAEKTPAKVTTPPATGTSVITKTVTQTPIPDVAISKVVQIPVQVSIPTKLVETPAPQALQASIVENPAVKVIPASSGTIVVTTNPPLTRASNIITTPRPQLIYQNAMRPSHPPAQQQQHFLPQQKQPPRPPGPYLMQPPTINIPEQPHYVYQQIGVMMSPRNAGDPRLASPRQQQPQAFGKPPSQLSPTMRPQEPPSPRQQLSPAPMHHQQQMHMMQQRQMLSPSGQHPMNNNLMLNRVPVTPILTPISKPMPQPQMQPPTQQKPQQPSQPKEMPPQTVVRVVQSTAAPSAIQVTPKIVSQQTGQIMQQLPKPQTELEGKLPKGVILQLPQQQPYPNHQTLQKQKQMHQIQQHQILHQQMMAAKQQQQLAQQQIAQQHQMAQQQQQIHQQIVNQQKQMQQQSIIQGVSKTGEIVRQPSNIVIHQNQQAKIPPPQQPHAQPHSQPMMYPSVVKQTHTPPKGTVVPIITQQPTAAPQIVKPEAEKKDVKEQPAIDAQDEVKPKEDSVIKSGTSSGQENTSLLTEENVIKLSNVTDEQMEQDSKEDSDYWSAKEVNIESVIKKVDALCSGEDTSEEGSEATTKTTEWSEENQSTQESSKNDEKETLPVAEKPTEPEAPEEEFDEGVCDNPDAGTKKRGRAVRGRKVSESTDKTPTNNNNIESPEAMAEAQAGGVQTRRGGKTANRRKGGRVTRGTLANVSPTSAASTSAPTDRKTRNQNSESDVYEFHEDSGEEVGKATAGDDGRPRLILTIKSPAPPPVTAPTNPPITQPPPPVSEPSTVSQSSNPSPPSSDDFTSPAANTRKSRRLQERDGRSTVDDVIEDVVKNVTNSPKAGSVTPPRRTTRSTMNISPAPVVPVKPIVPEKQVVDVRKSPRANRNSRNKDRKLSETSTDSNEERKVEAEPVVEEKVPEVKKMEPPEVVEKVDHVPQAVEQPKKVEILIPLKPDGQPGETNPTTLIDPVTGELMVMRQSKEGQYIPVPRSGSQAAHLMAKHQQMMKGMPQLMKQPDGVVRPTLHQEQIQQQLQQQPIAQQQIPQQQLTHQPIAQQQMTHQPIAQQQMTHQPIAQQQIPQQQLTHQPIPQQQMTHQPIAQQQMTHQPNSQQQNPQQLPQQISQPQLPQMHQPPPQQMQQQPQQQMNHPPQQLQQHVPHHMSQQHAPHPQHSIAQTINPNVATVSVVSQSFPTSTAVGKPVGSATVTNAQIPAPITVHPASTAATIITSSAPPQMRPHSLKAHMLSSQATIKPIVIQTMSKPHPGAPVQQQQAPQYHMPPTSVQQQQMKAPQPTQAQTVAQGVVMQNQHGKLLPPPKTPAGQPQHGHPGMPHNLIINVPPVSAAPSTLSPRVQHQPPVQMKQQITITQQQAQPIHMPPQKSVQAPPQQPQMVIHGGKMMPQPPPSGYATVLQSGKMVQASPPPQPPANLTKQQHMQVQQQMHHQQQLAKQQHMAQKHHLVVKQQQMPLNQQQLLSSPSAAHQATKHIQSASSQIHPQGMPQQSKGVMGLHQSPQILTGAVASPPPKQPHLTSQQPIVTGASSSRITVPPISPQGQARGHILQAGLPVPAFEASLGDGPYPPVPLRGVPRDHHIMMYHHHPYIRPQEAMNHGARIPYMPRSPMLPGSGDQKTEEIDDTSVASPPLELRRPASGPRTTAVPHSLQSPQDRATDSPQVAQVYVPGTRIPHPHYPDAGARSYYESGRPIQAEPPPAHRPSSHSVVAPMSHPPSNYPAPNVPTTPTNLSHMYSQHPKTLEREREQREREKERETRTSIPSHTNMPSHGTLVPAMPAPTGRNLQVATPPHASQVPPQADSLMMLLQRYPVMWQGLLALKNDQAAVQMHFVFGNPQVAGDSLPCNSDGSTPPLRIAQRMRLEQTQLEGVARKMQTDNEHCMLLALPCGRDHMDVLQQSTNLTTGFITYLQQKQAAGIVNIAAPGSQQAAYVVHIFPSCDFANENLARIAPDLLHRVADIAHLLIVIATV